MSELTRDQSYELAMNDVKLHCRFPQIDNLLPLPTDEEIKLAIQLSIDDINVYPPKTSVTIESAANSVDAWYSTVILGACKNTVRTLIADWTANGINANIDSLTLESKLSDYQALYERFLTDFNERLERIKKSYGAATKGLPGALGENSMYGSRVVRSKSLIRGGAYHNSGNRGFRYNSGRS